MKILIVDSRESQRELIKEMLKELGFTEIETFASGEKALKTHLMHRHADLIISEYFFDGMSGIDFITKARRVSSRTKFILATACIENDFQVAAEKLNVPIRFEPISKEYLKEAIDEVLT